MALWPRMSGTGLDCLAIWESCKDDAAALLLMGLCKSSSASQAGNFPVSGGRDVQAPCDFCKLSRLSILPALI